MGFGIAASLGGTIGVGILRAPGIVATHLPNSTWIIATWIAGGIFAFLGTLCVIELGTSMPKAGGWYVYTRKAFGDFPGFVIGWSFWLAVTSSLGYASIALGDYLGVLMPTLVISGRFLGAAILIGFLLFQMLGLRPVSWFQEFTGFAKGAVLLALVFACLWFAARLPPTEQMHAVEPVHGVWFALSAIVAAMQAVIKTYDGWYTPSCFIEEDKNPTRNLPRAMMWGTGLVTVIYVGMNIALLSVLTIPEMAGSNLAAATAFEKIFGTITGKVITSLAVLNIAGLLSTLFLAAPRVLFAMARDGMFFRRAAVVNAKGVPVFATVFTGVTALLMASSGSFDRVFAVSAILAVICYAAGYASLFALRRRFPELPRPFKVWGYPVIPIVALVGSLLFILGTIVEDHTNSLLAAFMVGLSYPVYVLLRRSNASKMKISRNCRITTPGTFNPGPLTALDLTAFIVLLI